MYRKVWYVSVCSLYAALLLTQCAPLGVHQIILRSSQTLMPADGENKTTLQMVALDASRQEIPYWSQKIQLYLNNKEYDQTTFQTDRQGTYYFVARMGPLQSNVVSVQATDAREYVYRLMTSSYLWADKIKKSNAENFQTPEDIVDRLAYRPERKGVDRWTHIQDRVSYDNYYQGKYVGLGIRMAYDANNQLRIALVYEGTPAHEAGIRRGMLVKSINGKTVKEIEDQNLWGTVFGKDEEGVEVAFQLEHNGETQEYKAAKTPVQLRSVFAAKFHKVAEKTVGYLYFDRFISPSSDELKKEFGALKAKDVDELVLDMRYNGGGLLHVATLLGSLLAGDKGKDKIFYKYAHNENFKQWDSASRFEEQKEALQLKRIFVITSGSTASASEVVINGLRPIMPVIMVGRATYGKPVGAYNYGFFNKIISLISFRVVNDAGEGDYFGGLKPNITADDDITHDLGDAQEACLKAALQAVPQANLPLQPAPAHIPATPRKRIPWTGIRQLIQAF